MNVEIQNDIPKYRKKKSQESKSEKRSDQSIIRELFNENREEIMNRAAKLVADSVKKSKYYKEGINDICKEVKK